MCTETLTVLKGFIEKQGNKMLEKALKDVIFHCA